MEKTGFDWISPSYFRKNRYLYNLVLFLMPVHAPNYVKKDPPYFALP